jgi:hypothetical protein
MHAIALYGYELGAPERSGKANQKQGTVAQAVKRVS